MAGLGFRGLLKPLNPLQPTKQTGQMLPGDHLRGDLRRDEEPRETEFRV